MNGHVTHIKVIDLSAIMSSIEDIEDLFDEPISIEVLCADYLATISNAATYSNAEVVLLEDYNAGELFAKFGDEDKELIYDRLTEFMRSFWSLLVYNAIEISTVTPWQVFGRRGQHHILLAKTIAETP